MATQTNNKPTALTVTDGEQPVGGVASEHTIPPTAILVTEKCYLRPYEVSDAEPMAEAANDPEITKYLRSRFPSPYTLADAHEFIALCRSLPAPALSFGIFTLEGEIAGSMALEPPKGDPVYAGTRELGYYLVPKFWGRGSKCCLDMLHCPSSSTGLMKRKAVVVESFRPRCMETLTDRPSHEHARARVYAVGLCYGS